VRPVAALSSTAVDARDTAAELDPADSQHRRACVQRSTSLDLTLEVFTECALASSETGVPAGFAAGANHCGISGRAA